MTRNFKTIFKEEKKYWLAAFFIPILVMVIAYLTVSVYPGSKTSILASDAFSQFSNFHVSFRNMLQGKQSIFYTWNGSLGLNYLSLVSYYLGGIFTPLVILLPAKLMPDTIYFLTLLKFGSAGLAFWTYSRNTYKIKPPFHVGLAVSYALMGFTIAYSELIMWLDVFVWLPLVILGINRIMDLRKPKLLFFSYLFLFLTSYYFGFMVGIFSVLYFILRTLGNWHTYKSSILHYFATSILAGLASMIMILPAIIDLSTNGETLSEITKFKTADSSWFDLVTKNMVGIYDTTKYGSIPFIYIGLIPLLLVTFYFVTRKISSKEKYLSLVLFAILIASFYIEPLNLFWQGMHSPNMFLFRFSFLFSMLMIMVAGSALEKFETADLPKMSLIISCWILLFIMAYTLKQPDQYSYITNWNLFLTIGLLVGYLILTTVLINYTNTNVQAFKTRKYVVLALSLLLSVELITNASLLVQGVKADWNYPSRSLFTEPYDTYTDAVKTTQKEEQSDGFYRMENLTPISANDSFNYNFSGVSMFSSIRNRNTSSVLSDLGFRSRGTNLNIRYQNNTLIMDSLLGIRYNQTKDTLSKFGYQQSYKNDTYKMYKNNYAANLGIVTNKNIFKTKFPENNNLASQTNLLNQLSNQQYDYFSSLLPTLTSTDNVSIDQSENNMKLTELKTNVGKTLTWEVTIPANRQAYMSLFPTNFSELKSSTAELRINGTSFKTQVGINGQYYDLGYYPETRKITYSIEFYGTQSLSIMPPKVILLDTQKYEAAMTDIQKNDVPFEVTGRKATAQVNVENDKQKTLFTTIPFDKGWKAKVNGKKVATKDFKDAFLTIPLEKGENKIELSFMPQGFILGLTLFITCTLLFFVYNYYLQKITN